METLKVKIESVVLQKIEFEDLLFIKNKSTSQLHNSNAQKTFQNFYV